MIIEISITHAFLEFQIEHYTERYNEEKRFETRVWLRKELYNLKQRLKSILN